MYLTQQNINANQGFLMINKPQVFTTIQTQFPHVRTCTLHHQTYNMHMAKAK